MLDTAKPDIVVFCSKNHLVHFEQLKEAAQRRIRVYCEKPVTARFEEADQIKIASIIQQQSAFILGSQCSTNLTGFYDRK